MNPVETLKYGLRLLKAAKTHEQWLHVMRFGLKTMGLHHQVLIACIFAEAEVEQKRQQRKPGKNKPRPIAMIAWDISTELNLRIVPA